MSDIKSPAIMRKEQIPAFVRDLIEVGCDMIAFGHDRYFLGDSDLSCDDAKAKASEITRAYGQRDHLVPEIAEHLRSIGRYIDFDESSAH